MNQGWMLEERRLWDAMMDPGRVRKRLTAHSMLPGPERNKLLQEIEKQRQKNIADGWRNYATWLRHLPP